MAVAEHALQRIREAITARIGVPGGNLQRQLLGQVDVVNAMLTSLQADVDAARLMANFGLLTPMAHWASCDRKCALDLVASGSAHALETIPSRRRWRSGADAASQCGRRPTGTVHRPTRTCARLIRTGGEGSKGAETAGGTAQHRVVRRC